MTIDDIPVVCPRRPIRGMSAVLLPIDTAGQVDWDSLVAHLRRTADAGLTPAVNVEADAPELTDEDTRREVLRHAQATLAGRGFVAGAFVADRPGDAFQLRAYVRQVETILEHGGVPVLFPSYGLTRQNSEHIVNDYEAIAACCDRFLALEIDERLAPFGRMYGLQVYEALLEIPECMGAVVGSFHRMPQWQRLKLRDRLRPDFLVLSGNELALDMVTYGSDYLLAASTFAPDWFALRDRLWEQADVRFYELNDLLQRLSSFAFRDPASSYRHSAAQFLQLRGWMKTDTTHSASPRRPETDVAVLREMLVRIEMLVDEIGN